MCLHFHKITYCIELCKKSHNPSRVLSNICVLIWLKSTFFCVHSHIRACLNKDIFKLLTTFLEAKSLQIFWVHCGKTWGSGWITWLWPWHWKHLDLQVGIFLLDFFSRVEYFQDCFFAWIFDPGTGKISILRWRFRCWIFFSHRLNIFKNIFRHRYLTPAWETSWLLGGYFWVENFSLTGWFLRIFPCLNILLCHWKTSRAWGGDFLVEYF